MRAPEREGSASEKKSAKKVEKLLKKYLTKENGCDIIVKLSARAGSEEWSLKIEQQERSTKHIANSAKYESRR